MSSGNNTNDSNRPLIKASDMDEELLVLLELRKKWPKWHSNLSIPVSMKPKLLNSLDKSLIK